MHGRIYRKHRGVIFDLDGTLVDSRLDFAAMRRDLGLTADEPILEALASQPDDAARARLHQILLRHEYAGAEAATPMPGVLELISRLRQDGLKIGIFTRNAREVTVFKLHRLGLAVDDVIAREDAPPKPDPAGLLALCTAWAVGPEKRRLRRRLHL